jgi:hypothetical protein
MFQLVTCKMVSSDSILQGAKTMETEKAKSGISGSTEDLIHLPVWPNPSNTFLTSLMSAHIALN